MQLDMHYYGTYAIARSAGFNLESSKIIATAAQFVDDNAEKESVDFRDGGRLDAEATAHHALNFKNLDREDQRKIWVPFHFLPGNEGDTYTERLVCRKDSKIAQEMVEFNLSLIKQPYALPLIGITAHVYEDTFSHYGFSGISSRRNRIVNDSIKLIDVHPEAEKHLREKEKKFNEDYSSESRLANIKSWFAEKFSGALGHGAAVTFPDRPFLKWSFQYEHEEENCPVRDNPQTFLESCEKLHSIFTYAAKTSEIYADKYSYKEFSKIKDIVSEIINTQTDKEGRIRAWQKAATEGHLFGTGAEEIPEYAGDSWHTERDSLKRKKESNEAIKQSVFRFYQAASIHRIHIIRNLLPSHGLVVA